MLDIRSALPNGRFVSERLLHLIPYRPVNDRILRSGKRLALVPDLADVDAIPEEMEKAAATECDASDRSAVA